MSLYFIYLRQDIDECKGQHGCPGDCINTDASYQCNCSVPGYRPSSVPTVCEDVDECLTNNGGCQDMCINTRGSYKCRCEQRGRRLAPDRHACEDVNECERYKTKACRHGTCHNTDGSYFCACLAGFVAERNGSVCSDIDECADSNGGCEQLCVNTQGSYHCACNPGYGLDLDMVTCIDDDECIAKTDACDDVCVNTPGGFFCACTQLGHELASDNKSCSACSREQYFDEPRKRCSSCPDHAHAVTARVALSLTDCRCDPGYRGSPARHKECTDVDECSERLMTCSHTCVNVPGSAYCTCPTGYDVDASGLTCVDVDECSQQRSGWAREGCSDRCLNLPGSYTCQCPTGGYLLDIDGHTCTDVDECKHGTHNCSHECANTAGGFHCKCPPGFHLSKDGATCKDINECSMARSPCQQMCNNSAGSYSCGCFTAGFRLSHDQRTCVDVNECMEGDNPCPDICMNTVGSYLCDCNRPGYRLAEDSSGCVDINECDDPAVHRCEQVCVNLPGQFRCDCRPGYRRMGNKACQACPQGMYRPADSPHCLRCPALSSTSGPAKGSLSDCYCDPGYTGHPATGETCKDVDECRLANFGCQHRCVNTVGNAFCACEAGYRLSEVNRKTCDDVDECQHSKGRCHQLCVNTVGSYTCDCVKPQFTLSRNGYSCDDVDECRLGLLRCQHQCVNTVGGANCTCPAGYQLMTDGTSCEDVDECATDNGQCEDQCINTLASFQCKCTKKGFIMSHDRKQCVDIDECLNHSLCEGSCENIHGSYRCRCLDPGSVLGPDGHSCQDVDECQINNHTCDQVCVNTNKSYNCDCFPGYFRLNGSCVACPSGTYRNQNSSSRDGCAPCPPNMSTLTPASTSRRDCHCSEGYAIFPTLGTNCRDVNECTQNNGGCSEKCENTLGSFRCSCEPGYSLAANKKFCHRSGCPPLEPPPLGRLMPAQCQATPARPTSITPDTVCAYRCQRGYQLIGDAHRTCSKNGTWSGTPATCVPATCQVLRPPDNGYLSPALCRNGPVPFRTRCHFRCRKDFRLQGKSGTKCQSQHWTNDGSNTQCVPKGQSSP